MSVFMGANNKETNQHLSLVNIIELFFKYFFDNFSSGEVIKMPVRECSRSAKLRNLKK